MRFSVLLGCYGDYPEYTLRAVNSVITNNRTFDLHVGCNICGKKTIRILRELYDESKIDTLIELNKNIYKDQMMRLLIERTQTEYALWIDDDSHVFSGWDVAISEFIDKNKPFDGAGQLFVAGRYPEYQELSKLRPWWKSGHDESKDVYFPIGGLFMFRTDFMRKHDFPDRNMIQYYGDMFFGDLITQQKGVFKIFNENIVNKIKINDGARRNK